MSTPRVELRVVVFQPTLPRYREAFFRKLAERLRSLTVVSGPLVAKDGFAGALATAGFEHRVVAHRRVGPLFWMPAMWRMIDRRTVDAAVFTWNTRYLHLMPAVIRARRRGVASVVWGHGYSKTESGSRRRLRNWVGAAADAMLTYGRKGADGLVADGLPAERVFVAPNAIDQSPIQAAREAWLADRGRLAAFAAEHGLEGRPLAIHIARLNERRGVDLLFDAWKRITADLPNALLAIIGDGAARPELESAAAALGLSDSVRFLGAIYGEDALAPWFLQARAMAFPLKMGLSLHHAMGYGVPIVTVDAPDQHGPEYEALEDGVNGYATPPGDVDAYATRLRSLLSSADLAAQLGHAARETMLSKYSLGAMCDGYVDALTAAARRRG